LSDFKEAFGDLRSTVMSPRVDAVAAMKAMISLYRIDAERAGDEVGPYFESQMSLRGITTRLETMDVGAVIEVPCISCIHRNDGVFGNIYVVGFRKSKTLPLDAIDAASSISDRSKIIRKTCTGSKPLRRLSTSDPVRFDARRLDTTWKDSRGCAITEQFENSFGVKDYRITHGFEVRYCIQSISLSMEESRALFIDLKAIKSGGKPDV